MAESTTVPVVILNPWLCTLGFADPEVHCLQDLPAQTVLFLQVAELARRGLVLHRLLPRIISRKPPHHRRVVERFLHPWLRLVEPLLEKVNAQHPLQTNGWHPLPVFGWCGSIRAHNSGVTPCAEIVRNWHTCRSMGAPTETACSPSGSSSALQNRPRLAKRRRGLMETNPPRNSQSETHRDYGLASRLGRLPVNAKSQQSQRTPSGLKRYRKGKSPIHLRQQVFPPCWRSALCRIAAKTDIDK